MSLRVGLVTALTFGGLLLPPGGPKPACAQEQGPHAVLVVDRGSQGGALDPFCVSLGEAEVSGREFIELAAQQYREVNQISFGHGGEAVCMLADVGTTEDECLQPGEPFWGYWRSEGGRWEWSSEGITGTTVDDGDIEGWSWDTETGPAGRNRPPHPSFSGVCGYEPGEPEKGGRPERQKQTPSGESGRNAENNQDDGDPDEEPPGDDSGSSLSEDNGAGKAGPMGEGRLDSAPIPSEFDDPLADLSPLPQEPRFSASPSPGPSLPAGATSADAEPQGFPAAGILAIVATIAMAGVAAYLLTKRKST
ncbi:MAG: hypothetical protein M3285_09010 [Actinomycetota bacterium]|nr:hypothetical protein [Actinomycetota bacterium]